MAAMNDLLSGGFSELRVPPRAFYPAGTELIVVNGYVKKASGAASVVAVVDLRGGSRVEMGREVMELSDDAEAVLVADRDYAAGSLAVIDNGRLRPADGWHNADVRADIKAGQEVKVSQPHSNSAYDVWPA